MSSKHVVKNARKVLIDEETEQLLDMDKIKEEAIKRAEQSGFIFIDEFDKITSRSQSGSGPDVSREGVQRDILPIVEGSKVNTKFGLVDTSHILFIAAGAFHMSKPSDLIPELQGRFPLRVELDDLTSDDFNKILTQPQNALITQYKALLETEEVILDFTKEAVKRLSVIAAQVNSKTENIGATYSDTSAQVSQNNTVNYEISKSIQKVVEGTGNIKRLTVATVINDEIKQVKKETG